MDDVKEPLTDVALERDLEALLAVDPSPEFMAKVRSRVTREPMRTPSFRMWRLALAGVVVAPAVVLILSIAARGPARVDEARPESRGVQGGPAGIQAPASDPRVPAPVIARSDRRPAVAPARRVETAIDRSAQATTMTLPEVIIEESERRGFDLLLAELRDVKDAAAIARAASGRETPGPPWLDVDPVIIEPLPQVMMFEGEGQ
jgi:hypothetical protein